VCVYQQPLKPRRQKGKGRGVGNDCACLKTGGYNSRRKEMPQRAG
jgi:hypothetical protein